MDCQYILTFLNPNLHFTYLCLMLDIFTVIDDLHHEFHDGQVTNIRQILLDIRKFKHQLIWKQNVGFHYKL